MADKQYICLDQKSFYATVECVARGLDPMTTDLVVADPERSQNTICLAVSPALKAKGVSNRCRIKEIPKHLKYIVATPRMQLYIECAAEIYGVFLKYVAPEDIHVYSIDESFLDLTPYLKLYNMSARELAQTIMQDIRRSVGTVSTCGIGTNLYLAKIALDIQAKHAKDFIGELDEKTYRQSLWDHRPITDFWRISTGTETRLRNHGIFTMRDIAMTPEDYLYRWFGIDAELLIDHAWGREPTTIADIKAYRSKSKSISSGQVLMRDYSFQEGLIIVKEMMDQLCLDMVAKKLVTESVSLYVGYSHSYCDGGTNGTAKVASQTNADSLLIPAISTLYQRIVNPAYPIRRICLCCNNVAKDSGAYQINMFEDVSSQLRNRAIQETMLCIKAKYGKNAILKGTNYDPAATGRERNLQIGGHKSNG